MSNTKEYRQAVQGLFHFRDLLQRSLEEMKQEKARNGSSWHDYGKQTVLIDHMVKQANAYIQFIQDASFILLEDKDSILVDFVKLKLDVSDYHHMLNFDMINMKLEKLAEKYNAKSNQCKKLESKLRSLESKIAESEPSMDKIHLTSPLVIIAKSTGLEQKTHCFVFDQGHTTYHDLRKKIQEAFSLETFILQTKIDDVGNEFKTISTTDDYKEAIEVIAKDGDSAEHGHWMKIHIKPTTGQDDLEINSDTEGESDVHSEEFVNLSEQDSSLVLPNPNAKFTEEGNAKENHY
ncbi:hypothetical protein EC973_004269, partial [Apophysomyces ossiformis]